MKVKEVMTSPVIPIQENESVEVAARMLEHYNIGSLPVCGEDGKLCGVITDRDLVTRCLASNRKPERTRVRDVMTGSVVCAQPDWDVQDAAKMMGNNQIRRLPVTENGILCGMVSLGDLAEKTSMENCAVEALHQISENKRGF